MSKRLLLALLVAVLGLAAPAEARRDGGNGGPGRGRDEQQRARISIEQAIQSVQRATGGRVLDARDERDEYRVKVLTRDGEVRTVRVDAYSGAMR